jgi:hypothetical protein
MILFIQIGVNKSKSIFIIKSVALDMGSEGFGIHHSIINMLEHT